MNLVRRDVVAARHEAMNAEAAAGRRTRRRLNYAHQAAALFVTGYATLLQGEEAQVAKPKLSRALKPRTASAATTSPAWAVPEPHRDHCAGHPRRRSEPIPGHAAELVHA